MWSPKETNYTESEMPTYIWIIAALDFEAVFKKDVGCSSTVFDF